MEDYQKDISVNKTTDIVYDSLATHIADWWSNDFSGAASAAGDHFKIAFGGTKKTFKIIEATPHKRIVWECVSAYIDMAELKNKAEWVGTKMIWSLETTEKGTIIHFLHQGLTQRFECWQVCEEGWDFFLESLKAYLNTGNGNPYIKG